MIVGGVVGFLAIAMIAPLGAGLLIRDSESDEVDTTPTIPLTTDPPTLVDDEYAGATLTGPTPCPTTDGTQERTTSFETAPPTCIEAGVTYATIIDAGPTGAFTVTIDPSLAPEAANLFVTFADYGVYDQAFVTPLAPGITVLGGEGDAGFSLTAAEPPADGEYDVGSVVMFTRIDGSIQGQFLVVTTEEGAAALEENPVHPIIGEITDGLDVAEALYDASLAAIATGLRLESVAVDRS